jgi:hypothetical protein
VYTGRVSAHETQLFPLLINLVSCLHFCLGDMSFNENETSTENDLNYKVCSPKMIENVNTNFVALRW